MIKYLILHAKTIIYAISKFPCILFYAKCIYYFLVKKSVNNASFFFENLSLNFLEMIENHSVTSYFIRNCLAVSKHETPSANIICGNSSSLSSDSLLCSFDIFFPPKHFSFWKLNFLSGCKLKKVQFHQHWIHPEENSFFFFYFR